MRARLRWRDDAPTVLKVGPLTVDLAAHRVLVNDRDVRVSARELSLLAAFVTHPGQVLSRPQLLRIVWDVDFDTGSNVVDVHVAALRRKIGADLIETVRGAGYRFVVDPAGRA